MRTSGVKIHHMIRIHKDEFAIHICNKSYHVIPRPFGGFVSTTL